MKKNEMNYTEVRQLFVKDMPNIKEILSPLVKEARYECDFVELEDIHMFSLQPNGSSLYAIVHNFGDRTITRFWAEYTFNDSNVILSPNCFNNKLDNVIYIFAPKLFHQFGEHLGIENHSFFSKCNEFFINTIGEGTIETSNDFIDDNENLLEVNLLLYSGVCAGYYNISDRFILLNKFYTD